MTHAAILLALSTLAAPAPAASPAAAAASPAQPPVVLDAAPVKAAPAPPPDRVWLDFSHRTHTARALKTKCVDCHRLGEDGNRFRPSGQKTCTPCHKEKDLLARFDAATAARAARPAPTPLPAGAFAVHKTHVYYDCQRCHGAITASEKVGDQPLPPLDNSAESCVTCHGRAVTFSHAAHLKADRKIGGDCNFCHQPRADGAWFANPGHPQCRQCHDISLLGLTEGCNLCHVKDAKAPKTFDLERASRLHHEHPVEKVACTECHAANLTAETVEAAVAARATASDKSCGRCHKIPK